MPIKTIIELQAKAGLRDELLRIMTEVTATMQAVPGFLGYEFYEVLDNPDDKSPGYRPAPHEWGFSELRRPVSQPTRGTLKIK
jgi:hypothetical protein